MAILDILQFPDARLRQTGLPVSKIDQSIHHIVNNLYETLYSENGIGLAATQVGIAYRIFVMDLSEKRDQGVCVINPEITSSEGEQYEIEGCLSIHGVQIKVKRAKIVQLKGISVQGTPFELEGTGLLATCIQHEVDHLNGILLIDHLSRIKRERMLKKLQLKN